MARTIEIIHECVATAERACTALAAEQAALQKSLESELSAVAERQEGAQCGFDRYRDVTTALFKQLSAWKTTYRLEHILIPEAHIDATQYDPALLGILQKEAEECVARVKAEVEELRRWQEATAAWYQEMNCADAACKAVESEFPRISVPSKLDALLRKIEIAEKPLEQAAKRLAEDPTKVDGFSRVVRRCELLKTGIEKHRAALVELRSQQARAATEKALALAELRLQQARATWEKAIAHVSEECSIIVPQIGKARDHETLKSFAARIRSAREGLINASLGKSFSREEVSRHADRIARCDAAKNELDARFFALLKRDVHRRKLLFWTILAVPPSVLLYLLYYIIYGRH
jgi:hypothetical protein